MISVIIPVFNLENHIEKCIRSIQNQIYKNLEIIIVDDGSSDSSREIITVLAQEDDRIVTIFKENGGVSSARIAGVKAARGEWVGFVDGDDIIEPEMYQILYQNAEEVGTDISHCGQKMVFPDGRINYFYNTGKKIIQNHDEGIRDLLSGTYIEPGLCNKLYKKSLFDQMLYYFPVETDIRINEDLLMNYYLFSLAHKSVYQDFCPYSYIVRYSSATRQNLNCYKIYDPIKVKQIILDSATDFVRDDAKRAYISTCLNVYNMLIRAGDGYSNDKNKIRSLIINNSDKFVYLPAKPRLLANLIKYVPICYPVIYRIYAKFFQKHRYD